MDASLCPKNAFHLQTKPLLHTLGQPRCPELVQDRPQPAAQLLHHWHPGVSTHQHQEAGRGGGGVPEPTFSSKLLYEEKVKLIQERLGGAVMRPNCFGPVIGAPGAEPHLDRARESGEKEGGQKGELP